METKKRNQTREMILWGTFLIVYPVLMKLMYGSTCYWGLL